jgi:hypothetical protein
MYCSHCGAANDNNVTQCVACGTALPRVPMAGARASVPNHLVWAILCTLFCCVPGGIVAIVYAAQVDGKVAAGDIAAAQASARNAATWCWISAGVGLVIGILYFCLVVLGSIAGNH